MSAEDLHAHLALGASTVARAWSVTRKDGLVMGFTDHDRDLDFDGLVFRADTGLSAKALAQSTGLSVDNTEAMGALSDDAITEEDVRAGRFDGAEVVAWLVNWQETSARRVMFRGFIGEVRRGAGAFHAELRGLTEMLNRPVGRIYQHPCTAVLGDAACGVSLGSAIYQFSGNAVEIEDARVFVLGDLSAYAPGWFERGRLLATTGTGAGLSASIKHDRVRDDGIRVIETWEPLRANLQIGDGFTIEAGCDKRFVTCREKFANLINFQGFPDIPEEDWMTVHPTQAKRLSGGSRR